MKNEFSRGDLVVLSIKGEAMLGLIDQISKDSFILITSFDSHFDYGIKIPEKYLSSQFLLKVDRVIEASRGVWEEY